MMRMAGRAVCLLAACLLQLAQAASKGPCEVETGTSSIILDIEESRGTQVNQSTLPAELPIVGTPGDDIALNTVFPKGRTLFELDGKKLQLLEPLDRDADNLSHIVFQLVCVVRSTNKRRTVPVIVRVSDINDNAPVFQNTPYETSISELTPIGTTIFERIKAVDIDSGVNGLSEYFIMPWDNSTNSSELSSQGVADGYSYFSIGLPHQGQVTVNRSLDYERMQKYLVKIVASDRARNTKERFSSTTTLTVNIKDDDDQDPSFIYQGCMLHEGACINPEYTTSVNSGVLAGILNISPEKIQAVDMDTLDSHIRYSIASGDPDTWANYFTIDSSTGAVRQIAPVDSNHASSFHLVIKAEEVTEARRFTSAKLTVTVKPVDANPPVIEPSAPEGSVEENSPRGTPVLDNNGNTLKLVVTDADLRPEDPKPQYTFELTTNYFDIDKSGVVIVNDDKLDRDPPNSGKFRFQVVAREVGGGAASTPLSLTVRLLDQNDNSPVLPRVPPVSVPAHTEPTLVYKVKAVDIDEGENARISYSLYHVSNNGANKFTIQPDTGDIMSTGRLNAGEQYSLTIRAVDGGGRGTQGIVEVVVAPGPNRRPPAFSARDYHAHVSEGAAINSTITTVTAKDPENDAATYSIVSGNDLRQFSIGSTTGIITVIRKLDREDLTRYQLLIKAEDPGKLSSTATVNIKVTDINDNNPEFEEPSYTFQVKEGVDGASVGSVHATDLDEGINAAVAYSVPSNVPFLIDNATGSITTNTQLDYETHKEYQFVVTATDGAVDKRLGTASVTVEVQDVPDEVPVFQQSVYHAQVPENIANYPVAQVQATDPDTLQEVTYIIKRGDTELFSIDRKSGAVRTLRQLDREQAGRHTLLIGTEENDSEAPGAVTVLEVQVQDKNDNTPIFTSVPRPITIEDSASIGTLVYTARASDADTTAPNNMVRYQLAGRGKASKYFQVDADTGALRVRDELRKDTDSEYTVDVRAYDQGEPSLSTVISLTVYVSHSATVPPDVGLGFADTLYTEHVPENAGNGTLVRNLPLLNKHAHHNNIPLKCHIDNGNQLGLFYVKITEDRDCALYLNTSSLDYEAINEYTLEIQLESLQGLINPQNSKTVINIHVTDQNDNAPTFAFGEQSSIAAAKDKYFAIVTKDMILDTNVVQVKAKDKDSGELGRIEYQKNSWTKEAEEYFSLDPDTGVIKNMKTFDAVPASALPFKFSVTARDNPSSKHGYNVARASVIINLLQSENQLVLEVSEKTPDALRRQVRDILSAVEERSGLIAGVEKVTPHQYVGINHTLETNQKATDVWFYLIDPNTAKILERDSDIVMKSVSMGVSKAIASRLQTPVGAVHAPIVPPTVSRRPQLVAAAPLSTVLPVALIALAAIVLVAASAAIVYICASWNRYKKHKERAVQPYGTIGTIPTIARSAPSVAYESTAGSDTDETPRYETQVLNMAVHEDTDLQLDFSLNNNHAFNIHSVHYLTKDNGERSPTLSESATTARASSVNGNRTPNEYGSQTFAANNTATLGRNTQTLNRHTNNQNPHALNNALGTLPRANKANNGLLAATLGRKINGTTSKKKASTAIMAYDEIPGTGFQRASDNDNVTFGKRNYSQFGFSYLNDRSPVETTTEL